MKSASNIVLSYLNTNSIMNIFGYMKDIFSGKIDIAIISAAKIDDPFLTKRVLFNIFIFLIVSTNMRKMKFFWFMRRTSYDL